jgi:hypothetical protein
MLARVPKGSFARCACALFLALAMIACADGPTTPLRESLGVRRSEGTVELEPVVAIACGGGWTGEFPYCTPPGGWIPGGSSPGAYTSSGGSVSQADTAAASPQGDDGPILALIVCLAGLGATGFTIYDAWDQTRDLLQDRADMLAAENRQFSYMKQLTSEEGGDEVLFELYIYEAEQARQKYEDDVSALAEKMHMSIFTLGTSVVGCGVSLAAPTF